MTTVLLCCLLAGPNLFPNGDFEGHATEIEPRPALKGSVTGTVAAGWGENSRGWADVDAVYEAIADRPHSGQQCQRVTAKAIRTGIVQMSGGLGELEPANGYAFEAWLRSPGTACQVTVQARLAGPPYQTYLAKTLTPGPDWTKVAFRFRPAEPENVVLLLQLGKPGTVDIDDVSVTALPEVSDAPQQQGNLVEPYRLGAGPGTAWQVKGDKTGAADPNPGPLGPGAAKIELGETGTLQCATPVFFLRYGQPHRLSIWAKSNPAGLELRLRVRGNTDWHGFGLSAKLTDQWQQYTATGQVPMVSDDRYYLELAASGKGQLYLDGLCLVDGTTEPALPQCGLALLPGQPWGLTSGEGPLPVLMRAVGVTKPGAKVVLSGEWAGGPQVDLGDLPVDTSGIWDHTAELQGPALQQYGLLRVSAKLVDAAGQPLCGPSETLVGRCYPPHDGDGLESPFGTHVTLREPDLQVVRQLGFRWCRLHDASILTKWGLVEPEQGKWVWYDDEMALARQAGLNILGMLCSSPVWASEADQLPDFQKYYWSIYYPPKHLEDWRNYVKTTVAHYAGVIDDWEIWNEPWGNFFRGGTPEQYAELMKAAYEEAKQANSKCTILGVDTYPRHRRDWTEKVLAASGLEPFDVLSYHQYSSEIQGGPGDESAQSVASINDEQRRYGTPKPLIDTEGGTGGDNSNGSFYSFAEEDLVGDWDRAADQVPRQYLAQLAAGVQRFFLYSVHNDMRYGQRGYMTVEPNYLLKPLHLSTSAFIHFIEGATWQKRLVPGEGISAHVFQRATPQETVIVLIADGESEVKLPRALPAGVTCYDRFGNAMAAPTTAGRSPVYLVAPGPATALVKVLGG